jgi:sugar/nucleoside kinase (ribokinase family)
MGVKYDTFIIGQISNDINVDYTGATVQAAGGAVVYSGFAASGLGHSTAVLPKANLNETDLNGLFSDASNVTVFPLHSNQSTSIKNVYHTADRERRTCSVLGRIDPYRLSDIPEIDASIYHIAGLMRGDIENEIITYSAKRALVALDVQYLLRYEEKGSLLFSDWKDKKEFLPMIDFLKTDAAEAEILTNNENRYEAAKILHAWGAREIMITHSTEVIVYDGNELYVQPLKPRNLSGRTGRGDTCFSAYITERLHSGIKDSLLTAAALVSLKMEKPGPFKGSRQDVNAYINEFYK